VTLARGAALDASTRRLACAASTLALGLATVDVAKADCRLLEYLSPALPVLEQKLDKLQLYRDRTRPECLSYMLWSCERGWTEIAVHGNHKPSCGGDPSTFPAVDHFRVSWDLKAVQWYDLPSAEYLPLQKVCEHQKCPSQKTSGSKVARAARPALSASASY
jgi:hypothetical protein